MKHLRFLFILFFVPFSLPAQQELALPLHENLPQASLLNPALMQNSRWHIGLPSVAFNFAHSGLSYHQLIRKRPQDDSLQLDMNYALGKLADQNYLFTNYNVNFLTIGYRRGGFQLGLYASEKVNVSLKYPKALPSLLWRGNGAYLGKEVNIGPHVKASKYREWAFSFAYGGTSRLQLGGRIKYLQGLADLTTLRNDLTLYTDTSNYALTVSTDYLLTSSRLQGFAEPLSPFDFNNPNTGWAADLGLQYQPGHRWTLAASILDLGSIHWKTDTRTYASQGEFTFEGIDLADYFKTDSLALDSYRTTLEERFGIQEGENIAYRARLVPEAYLSIKYRPDSSCYLSLQAYTEFIDGLHPAITLGYSRSFVRPFRLPIKVSPGIYWSYKNRSFYTLGFAGSLQYRSVQFYLAGDNLFSIFFPKTAIPLNRLQPAFGSENERSVTIPKHLKNYNFRLGLNLLLGKPKHTS